MIAISLKNVSKAYGTNVILKDASFILNEGEKASLVGINGAGKTTLFKIICGVLQPDSGEISISKDKRVGYLSQNLGLDEECGIFEETMKVFSNIKHMEKQIKELEKQISDPKIIADKTVHSRLMNEYGHLQEKYQQLDGYSCESYAKGILVGLGIKTDEFDKKIKYLSGGQKTRIALSKLLLVKPEILLLDEPTNHLDLDALNFLEGFLKDYKGTVIIISHDRYFLDVITTKTFELSGGTIDEYNGNYTYFINERHKRFEDKNKAYDIQQQQIEKLQEMIERYRSFNREKSIKQAESKEKALARIERIDKPTIEKKSAKISFDVDVRSGNDVLMIDNLSKAFGDNKLFSDLSLLIRRGERTALIGENGKGKSTLFKIVCNEIKSDDGYVRIGKNVSIGYYDQEQRNLSSEKTVIDELWDTYPNMTTTEVRNALAAFLFTGDNVFKKISDLSGGEKCRLSLLKVMLTKSNLLLLDEPTNHLDILSREALEDSLLEYEGTLFVISHDRYFLNKVIKRILELTPQGLVEYKGNYQYYVAKKNAKDDEIIVSTEGKTKTEIKEERRKLREIEEKKKSVERRIKEIENEIEKTEAEIEKLQEQMCLEEVYSNPEKSVKVNEELSKLNTKKDKLYEEWENLMEN